MALGLFAPMALSRILTSLLVAGRLERHRTSRARHRDQRAAISGRTLVGWIIRQGQSKTRLVR